MRITMALSGGSVRKVVCFSGFTATLCWLAVLVCPIASSEPGAYQSHTHALEEQLRFARPSDWRIPHNIHAQSESLALGVSRKLHNSHIDDEVPGKDRSFTGKGASDAAPCAPGSISDRALAIPEGNVKASRTQDKGNDRADRTLDVVVVLVAVGLLVLICVIIGIYCMWLHIHFSNHDTEGIYKDSNSGSAIINPHLHHVFSHSQYPTASTAALLSQSSISTATMPPLSHHAPSAPTSAGPTAPCANCRGSGINASGRCCTCARGSGCAAGAAAPAVAAAGSASRLWPPPPLAWQYQHEPQLLQQPPLQELRAAQLPVAAPQLRAESPVASVRSQSTQGAAPSNPIVGSHTDRELSPATPTGGTRATSVHAFHAYPHSQPQSHSQLRHSLHQQDSLPSGMELELPLIVLPPLPGLPGSLTKAASTPESMLKHRTVMHAPHAHQSTQNLVPYVPGGSHSRQGSDAPSRPTSQGAQQRPFPPHLQPVQTQSRNGTITSFPGHSSHGNSYGNSQASHASSPPLSRVSHTPSPPSRLVSRFSLAAAAMAAQLQVAGRTGTCIASPIQSSVGGESSKVHSSPGHSTTNNLLSSLNTATPVATRPGSSVGAVPAGRSGTSTPVDTSTRPASLEGFEHACAPCVSRSGLSASATVNTVEGFKVRTTAAECSSPSTLDAEQSVVVEQPAIHMHEAACMQPRPVGIPLLASDTGVMLSQTAVLSRTALLQPRPVGIPLLASDTGVMLSQTAVLSHTAALESEDSRSQMHAMNSKLHATQMHGLHALDLTEDVTEDPTYVDQTISYTIRLEDSQHTGHTRHLFVNNGQNKNATEAAVPASAKVSPGRTSPQPEIEAISENDREVESLVDTRLAGDGLRAVGSCDLHEEQPPSTPPPPPPLDTTPPDRTTPYLGSPLVVARRKSLQYRSDSAPSTTTATPCASQGTCSQNALTYNKDAETVSPSPTRSSTPVATQPTMHALPSLQNVAQVQQTVAAVAAGTCIGVMHSRQTSGTHSHSQRPSSCETSLTGELALANASARENARGPYYLSSCTASNNVVGGTGTSGRQTNTTKHDVGNPVDEPYIMQDALASEALRHMHDMHASDDFVPVLAPSSAKVSVPGGQSEGGLSGATALGDAQQDLGQSTTSAGSTGNQQQNSLLSSLNLTQSQSYMQTFMRTPTPQEQGVPHHACDVASNGSVAATDAAVVAAEGSASSTSGLACPACNVRPAAEFHRSARDPIDPGASSLGSAIGYACTTRIVHPATSCAVDGVAATGAIDEDILLAGVATVSVEEADNSVATFPNRHASHAQLDAHASGGIDLDSEPSQQLPPPPFSTVTVLMDSQLLTESSATDATVATAHMQGMHVNEAFAQSTSSTSEAPQTHAVDNNPNAWPNVAASAAKFASQAAHGLNDQEGSPCKAVPQMHAAHALTGVSPRLPNPQSMSMSQAYRAVRSASQSPRPEGHLKPQSEHDTLHACGAAAVAAPAPFKPHPAMHAEGPSVAMTVSIEAYAASALGVSHEQVADMLDALLATNVRIAGRFTLMGPMHRRLSGQGVVEFASGSSTPPRQKNTLHSHTPVATVLSCEASIESTRTGSSAYDDTAEEEPLAIKFYIVHAAFDRVASLWSQPPIRRLMSVLVDVIPQGDLDVPVSGGSSTTEEGGEGGGHGRGWTQIEMLPMVVMKRGTTLDEWARRAKPSLPMVISALLDVCEHLRELHACGYVYYALKPSNIVWLQGDGAWHLSDFGCASRSGVHAGLSFSLNYAAPELIAAQAIGSLTILSDPSADIWALGVTAFELLLGQKAFPTGTPAQEIRSALLGRKNLPWEEASEEGPGGSLSALRTLRHSVMSCLCRYAERRPTADELAASWRNLLEFSAVKHTVVNP